MEENYVKLFTESRILVRRLKSILEENDISCLVKSDKLPGYEISNFIDELFVLNKDVKRAEPIIEAYKSEINS